MKKLEDITDDNYIHLSLGKELKGKLINIARNNGLSLSSLVRMILTTYANKKEVENEE